MQSCGTAASRTADPTGCAAGHVRLMDTRYEVRDAQELAGLLADEGRTSFTQIGAIGGSYGGGMSMALAALKDRKMLPDGSLVAWQSPSGTPMQIAAATPEIPWTDLPYSLVPERQHARLRGRRALLGRTGVLKSSWENGSTTRACRSSTRRRASTRTPTCATGTSRSTTVSPTTTASGNPLAAAADIRDELTTHHSSYYIDHSQAPAPMLISNGWTDDLFPADEAIRFYNRTRTEYPSADISLFFGSFGHQRGQNKADALAARSAQELAWFDYYVRGVGAVPFHGVTTLHADLPERGCVGRPVLGRHAGPQLAPGEIRFESAAPQTILPTAGSTAIAAPFDPITGAGACATSSATDQADTATYRMDPVPTGGFTLLGSPTVVADITSPGSDSQIAARLLDVDTGTNTQTLVARGLWRPAITAGPERQVFQLHPNGYRFADGHVVKLELLPKDSNTAAANSYGRTSNNQQNVTIENLAAAAAGARAPGRARRPRPGAGAEDRSRRATSSRPASRRCSIRGPKGATPLRASLVVGVRGMHRPEPRRTVRRSRSRRATRRSRRRTTSPWGRRTRTPQRPDVHGLRALRRAWSGNPATPGRRGGRAGRRSRSPTCATRAT